MTTYPFPGYVNDVATLTDRIEATWGQAIRDRALQVFDTAANRASGLAVPKVGQVSVLTNPASGSDHGLWEYVGATDGWTKLWNLPWGRIATAVVTTAHTGIGTSPTDVTGMTVTFTAIANRRYIVRAFCGVSQQVTSQQLMTYIITDAVPNQLAAWQQHVGAGLVATPYLETQPLSPAAGSITYKLRAFTAGNTMNHSPNASSPAIFVVEDVGPSGAPS